MSHEIDQTTGRAAAMYAGEGAWHGLGTVIESAATSADAIKLAGLDWTVEKWPLFARQPAPGDVSTLAPRSLANVRTDTNAILGIVGHQYRVFQNVEAFDFMDALVDDKLAMYETAGSLKGGRRVWMLAKIPKEYRVGKDDVVQPYVLLTNAHDGTQSLRVFPTTIRVVCQNTLTLAIRMAQGGISIPHWPKLDSRIREARHALGVVHTRLDKFGEEMVALANRSLNGSESRAYFDSIFPTTDDTAAAKRNEKIVAQVLTNFDNSRNRMPGIEHTAWAAYNAVSEWTDHGRPSRGKTPTEKADNRLNSIWFGRSNTIKQQAYQAALALVA